MMAIIENNNTNNLTHVANNITDAHDAARDIVFEGRMPSNGLLLIEGGKVIGRYDGLGYNDLETGFRCWQDMP